MDLKHPGTAPNAADLTPHRQAWDLIPWLVAGSASAAERQLVQQHAADCADCREELAFHHSVKAGMHAAAPAPHSAEAALTALWARIDRSQAARPDMPGMPDIPGAAVRPDPRWTRWLVAAVLVQAVGLATLAGLLVARPGDAAYQTFSSPAPVMATPASLRLVPATSLPMGRLQTLLADNGLQIVASSRDGRVLSLAPVAGPALTHASATSILNRLRAEPGVVLVEPLQQPALP